MEIKTDTKSKIMQAAIRLFPVLGYEKTSMRRIAEEVGITKPALYYYFKNKDELFKSIVDFGNKFSYEKLNEIKKTEASIDEKLKQLVWIKFSFMNQDEEVKKFSGWLMTDGLKYLLKLDMEQELTKQMSLISDIIDHAIEIGELREDLCKDCFIYLLFGAANIYARRHYFFGEDNIDQDKVNKLIHTLLSSAKNN